MTTTSRPNLGGLFSGTTPPERSSSIADALRPRGADDDRAESGRESASSKRTPSEGTTHASVPAANAGPVPGSGTSARTGAPAAPHVTGEGWAALQWLDPVRALDYYFDFLQGMFDAQRKLTMGVARALSAPVRRAGVWR